MISGLVFDRDDESLHIETQGLGYQVHVPISLLAQYTVGQKIKLRIFTHVREDLIQLFGFESKAQEAMFRNLLKVNGIGPKVALGILSSADSEQFKSMIENKDVKALSRLPKMGKKTAEQILLKLGELDWEKRRKEEPTPLENPVAKKLKLALVNLGFSAADVHEVVMGLNLEEPFEDNFKSSLAQLSQM